MWPRATPSLYAAIAIADLVIRMLADHLALATYRAKINGHTSFCTSLWRREPSGLRMVFHQGA